MDRLSNRKCLSDFFWLIVRLPFCGAVILCSALGPLFLSFVLLGIEIVYFFKVIGKYKRPFPWMVIIYGICIIGTLYAFTQEETYNMRFFRYLYGERAELRKAYLVCFSVLFVIHLWRYLFDLLLRERKNHISMVKKLRKQMRLGNFGAHVSFPFGLIIQDDLNRLNGTFGKKHLSAVSMVILNWNKELKYYWKYNGNQSNTSGLDKYRQGQFFEQFRAEAAFYVALLDCPKYTIDEFRGVVKDLSLVNHHMISRPVFIYLSDANEEQKAYVSGLFWLREVCFINVKSGEKIDLELVVQKYDVTNAKLLKYKQYDYKKIMEEAGKRYSLESYLSNVELSLDDYRDRYPNNIYIEGFIQNYFEFDKKNIAVLTAFDYIDMVLRYMSLYVMCMKNLEYPLLINEGDIEDMGRYIFDNLPAGEMIYENIHTKIKITPTIREALDTLESIYPIKIDGEEINFNKLIKLLDYLRNRSRGHGSIRKDTAIALWEPLYVLLVLLDAFLSMDKFFIKTIENQVYVGFDESNLVSLGRYANVKSDNVCLVYKKTDDKIYYIDYISGIRTVPEIYSEA